MHLTDIISGVRPIREAGTGSDLPGLAVEAGLQHAGTSLGPGNTAYESPSQLQAVAEPDG